MKVKEISTGRIAEAKRARDFTDEEFLFETGIPYLWVGDEIFMRREQQADDGSLYLYMFDDEVEIIEDIEEDGGNE